MEKSLKESPTSVNSPEERTSNLEKPNPALGPAPSVMNEVISLRKDVNSYLEKSGSRVQTQGMAPLQFVPPLLRGRNVE